jgi:hypothetical protein
MKILQQSFGFDVLIWIVGFVGIIVVGCCRVKLISLEISAFGFSSSSSLASDPKNPLLFFSSLSSLLLSLSSLLLNRFFINPPSIELTNEFSKLPFLSPRNPIASSSV